MKILMTSTPATGRIDPLLTVGNVLMVGHLNRVLHELGVGPVSPPLFLEDSEVCAAALATAAGERQS
jgi:hypothetical protein